MDVKSKYVNGAWVLYDTYESRWVDAFGATVRKWRLENGNATVTTDKTTTASGTSPVTNAVTAGGKMLITTGATEYDGDNIQWLGTPFALVSGKPLYWGANVSISDATQSDLLVGLASTDTTLTAASSAHAVTVTDNGIYFSKIDGETTIYATSEAAGTLSSTAAGTMDTSAHWYEMVYDGTTLSTFFDGTLVSMVAAASIPSAVMTPSVAFRTGATAAITCTVNEFSAIQIP
jgi:hypothetical protein